MLLLLELFTIHSHLMNIFGQSGVPTDFEERCETDRVQESYRVTEKALSEAIYGMGIECAAYAGEVAEIRVLEVSRDQIDDSRRKGKNWEWHL